MAMLLHVLHASSKMFQNPGGIGFISNRLYEISTSKISNFKIKGFGVHPLRAASLDAGLAASSIMVEEQVKTPKLEKYVHFSPSGDEKSETGLSIIIVGASGELASTKIFPALFTLFNENRLPQNLTIVGYARRKMTDQELRNMISKTLACRIADKENCDEMMDQFLRRCFYHSGQYSSEEHFLVLDTRLREAEGGRKCNRLFYFSIPSTIYVDVARCVQRRASSEYGWTRVVLEKPFGHDLESFAQLTRGLRQHLREDQIFRIDHHLDEEMISNLLVLRFANLVFEPLWSRNYIRNVQMIFSEDSGVEARGNNFDKCGIIRDIMVNHLLPVLALFTMETPVSLDTEDIRNEKVKVLRSMKPPMLDNVVIGQYKGGFVEGNTRVPGYADHPTVCRDSLTPTFAAATLFINNRRWDGVPFFLVAGKGLESKRVEIRVQFRQVAGNLFTRKYGSDMENAGTNELVISVQPEEAIYLKIINKVPGFGMRTDSTDLNLLYHSRYPKKTPDGYERLLLDSIEGERTSFMRSDEVEAVWSLFSPVLNELEGKKMVPELYNYGSRGPVGAHYLAAKHNVYWRDHLC